MYRTAEPEPVIRRMAKELGVHHEALRNWIRQAEATPASEAAPVRKHVGWLHVVTIRTVSQRAPVGRARLPSGACSLLGKTYTQGRKWLNRCCVAPTCRRSSCGSGTHVTCRA